MGIGGLGHIALQLSKALGAETYALTHSPHKKDDAKALGAVESILTTEKDWAKKWAFKFDFILNCSDMMQEMNLQELLSILKVGGQFHTVGIADHPLPQLSSFAFAANAAKLTGSHLEIIKRWMLY